MSGDSFSVKAMTRLTGLNEHTLRAWERRYGAVTPKRGSNGRRVYTRQDVERLRNIAALVERGFGIGRIAKMSDQEIAQLLADHLELDQASSAPMSAEHLIQKEPSRSSKFIDRIHDSVTNFDLGEINALLTEARYQMGGSSFVLELIVPLMEAVGWRTLSGRITIAHEHAISAIVRAHLSGMMLEIPRRIAHSTGNSATFAVTTMEGNFHEIGILIASVLCSLRGIPNFFLGPNLPVDALIEAVKAFKAKHIVLGTTPLPPGTLPVNEHDYIIDLDRKLPADCAIWIGGPMPELKGRRLQHRLIHIKTLPEFETLLHKYLESDAAS